MFCRTWRLRESRRASFSVADTVAFWIVYLLVSSFAAVMLSNCFVLTGCGIFFDGDWSDTTSVSLESMPISYGESSTGLDLLLQNLTSKSWSMSTMSSYEDDQDKQVEVDGHPERSRILDCPQIVLVASGSHRSDCIVDMMSISSFINGNLPLIHLKDEKHRIIHPSRSGDVDLLNVKNGASDAVRIFVVGSALPEKIETVPISEFPARGT
ncbi:hypothetical protein BLNAU_15910 [Blattamonas nauphoetae]|uniref:Uncharacterized protein n=1 Tax=Blattamonas nauphoetae TaxID=2049346 RepID=A0ABQ9XCT5_9EUKA|nr:hypothetical protein BLNAU_15910 [Blattamonas nauphoetae]